MVEKLITQSIGTSLWLSHDQEIEKGQQIVNQRVWKVSYACILQAYKIFSLNYPYTTLTGIRASTFQTSTELGFNLSV